MIHFVTGQGREAVGDTPLKILFISAEVAPFVRNGSLADAVHALPRALAAQGHDVRVLTPWYREVVRQGVASEVLHAAVPLDLPGLPEEMPGSFALRQGSLTPGGIPVYFVDQPAYYDRDGLYGDDTGDYADNGDRFSFLALAAFAACRAMDFQPDVLHANDWHAGLVPVYLRQAFHNNPFFAKTGSLFTVHNLAFQGLFPDRQFQRTGLPSDLFNAEGLEFYGQVNTLKGALLFSDRVNTLSPRYADEIRNPEYGCGLDGVLRGRGTDLSGILSGLNVEEWDPSTDAHLPKAYDAAHPEGKDEVKRQLRQELGLPPDDVPLVAVLSRLDPMKGLDLIEEIGDYLMHLDLQFVLLGIGDARIKDSFQ
ncbi:MAG: glycogen synthase, partial [bacterium]